MTYSFTFYRKEGYLSFVVKGKYIFNELNDLIEVVRNKSDEFSCPKILFDFTAVEGLMPDLDKYKIGIKVAGEITGRIRMAIIDRPENINKFGETVSLNRGANVRVFNNNPLALQWLTSGRRIER